MAISLLVGIAGAPSALAAPTLTISSSPRSFSPNGDGNEDRLSLSLRLDAAANVTAVVQDAGGATVRTITAGQSFPTGSFSLEWDGYDNAGEIVPDGSYTIALSAIAAEGVPSTATYETAVDTRVPGVLAAPEAGSVLSGLVDLVVVPTAGMGVYQVSWWLPGCSWYQNRADADGSFRVAQADLSGCTSGAQALSWRVDWRDQFGQGHSYSGQVPVTVADAAAPVVAPTAWSGNEQQVLALTGPGQRESRTFYFRCTDNSTVTWAWQLRDATGAVVRTWAQGGNGTWWRGDCSTGTSYHAYVSVDGRDAGGALLPDGSYTLTATATDAGGLTGAGDATAIIDTRVPGVLAAPQAGSTLSGRPTFEFTQTEGFDGVNRIDLYLDATPDASFTMYNRSADGVWRTTYLMGGFARGPATLTPRVYWYDQFEVQHGYTAPPVEVAIDPVSIPLEASLDPAEGTAPLTTTLRATASDPQGRPLTLKVTWGDGSSDTLQVADPYDPVALDHEFTDPGTYDVFVSVSNGVGGYASQTIPLVVGGGANEAPTLDMTVTPTTGAAPLDVAVDLAAADPDGDDLTYRIDYGDGSEAVSGSVDGAGPLQHSYALPGLYSLHVQVSDGRLTASRIQNISVSLPEPLTAEAGDDRVLAAGDSVRFDGGGSRPSALITEYLWDFGDGTTGRGSTTHHVYVEAGVYEVTLTARIGTESATDTATVTVEPGTPEVAVAVSGGGSLLDGASVVLIDGADVRYSCTTGGEGDCLLPGVPDGSWAVYAWAPGYRPAVGEITVTDGTGATEIGLNPGAAAEVTLTSRPLTLEEIVEYGIDPDDPANQNAKEVTISLGGTKYSGIASSGGWTPTSSGGGGGGSSYSGGGYTATPSVRKVGDGFGVFWMIVPAKATWLKEFFQVTLLVQNLSDQVFTLTEGQAKLNLPSGLSLAPTAAAQSLTLQVPDIAGGGEAAVDWIVRGDEKGSYEPTADYAAVLQPLGAPLSLRAVIDEPIKVWGEDAVKMTVTADDVAYERYPYNMEISLTNAADVPVYNLALNVGEGDGSTYIHQPREQYEYDWGVLQPGETRTAPLTLIPRGTAHMDIALSAIRNLSGTASPGDEIEFREAAQTPATAPEIEVDTSRRRTANVMWEPVEGATEYKVFATSDPGIPFPEEPLVVVGADTTRAAGPIEDGQALYFAVSTTIQGSPVMLHPMTEAEGTLGSGPVIRVEDQNTVIIGNGSLVDNRNQAKQLTIRAFDADSQVPEIAVETVVRKSGYQDVGSLLDPTGRVYFQNDQAGGVWPSDLTEPVATHGSKLICRFDTMPVDDSNSVRYCDLPEGDYQEKLKITATDPDGHSTEHVVYVGPEYVALGDSFSSGQGAVPEGKDEVVWRNRSWFSQFGLTDAEDNQCHRSTEAYPNLLRGQAGVPDRFVFWACSGAEIWNVHPGIPGREGQEPNPTGVDEENGRPNGWAGERIQAAEYYPYASHVTFSIGGNDAGFADIIKNCAIAGGGSLLCPTWEGYIDDAKSWLSERLPKTYRTVLQSAPNADVYVMGYPRFFKDAWYNLAPCPNSISWDNKVAVGLSAVSQGWMNAKIDEVNEIIQSAIGDVGSSRLHFVDVYDAFAGHYACESEPWLNDFEDAGEPWPANGVYSFHPNRKGHMAIKERFLEEILDVEADKAEIGQGETKATTYLVEPDQVELGVAKSWDGSDVVTTLISPSGRVIDRDIESADVYHSLTATSETYRVFDPEPGEWRIESFGADLPHGKELLRMSIGTTPKPTPSPVAAATASATEASAGDEIVFDATASTDQDGNTVAYVWDFGDGQSKEGVSVTHTYLKPGVFEPVVAVIDSDGNASTARPGPITVTGEDLTVDSSPPMVKGSVSGTLGADGWHTSDVEISWTVEDPESDASSTAGCNPVTLSEDTAGLEITCESTSAGGTTTQSVTVKRDATPPVLLCPVDLPSILRGREGVVTVLVSDAMSGPVSDSLIQSVDSGSVGEFTASFEASDVAGNIAAIDCAFSIDQPAPPEAQDDEATGDEDSLVVIDVLGNDSDPHGDPLALAVVDAKGTVGAVEVNADGTVSYDPRGRFDGLAPGEQATDVFTYTISDQRDGGPDGEATATVTVTITGVDDAPVLVVGTAAVPGRYSDRLPEVAVSVTDDDSPAVELSADGLPAGVALGGQTCAPVASGVECTAVMAGTVLGDPGSYNAVVRAVAGSQTVSAPLAVTVIPEDARVWMASSNVTAVPVAKAGGDSPRFELQLWLAEAQPDTDAALALPGDPATADAGIRLVPVGPGPSADPLQDCSSTVSGEGYDRTVRVSCTFEAVPVNAYAVEASVSGTYQGSATGVLVVTDPSLGGSSGSGTLMWPDTQDPVSFAYSVTPNKKGKNLQGGLIVVRETADGAYELRSNALDGLALGAGEGMTWASFTGKATYLEPGWEERVGNHSFTLYAEERADGADRFWLQVRDKDGNLVDAMSMPAPGASHAIPLEAGYLSAPAQQTRKRRRSKRAAA